jgi:hypothetical protein
VGTEAEVTTVLVIVAYVFIGLGVALMYAAVTCQEDELHELRNEPQTEFSIWLTIAAGVAWPMFLIVVMLVSGEILARTWREAKRG